MPEISPLSRQLYEKPQMRRLLLFFLVASSVSFAGTITIPSGSTQPQIQKYFNSATSTNNLIAFSAGTYNIFTSLKLPCVRGGVTITGPAIRPTYTSWGTLTYSNQTAILSSSSRRRLPPQRERLYQPNHDQLPAVCQRWSYLRCISIDKPDLRLQLHRQRPVSLYLRLLANER